MLFLNANIYPLIFFSRVLVLFFNFWVVQLSTVSNTMVVMIITYQSEDKISFSRTCVGF